MSNSLCRTCDTIYQRKVDYSYFCEDDGQGESLFGDVCDIGTDNGDSDSHLVESDQKYS